MSYTPKTWECGETITADALNHIEQGIADSGGGGAEPLIVNIVDHPEQTKMIFDKTWNEIKTAYANGQNVVLRSVDFSSYDEFYVAIININKSKYDDPAYTVQTIDYNYVCATADGYPYYYYGD